MTIRFRRYDHAGDYQRVSKVLITKPLALKKSTTVSAG